MATKKKTEEIVEETTEEMPSGKKSHKRRPDMKKAKSMRFAAEDDKVSKRINQLHEIIWEWPPVDLDDVEGTNQRTIDFFNLCNELNVKALWETYAYALGYSMEALYRVMRGQSKKASKDIIVKAHWRLKSDLAQLSASGQINPVTAIFAQKNNFGYVDKVEITATTADPLGEEGSLTDIKRRLIESVPTDDVVGEANFVLLDSPKELVGETAKTP